MIERELKGFGKAYTEQQRDEIISNISARIGMSDPDDFYNSLGYGGMSLSKIVPKLRDEFIRVVMPEGDDKLSDISGNMSVTYQDNSKKQPHGINQAVIVDGIDNCQIRFARCCNPLPGDKIIGFVTRGFGVSVHKQDCPNAIAGTSDESEKDRWVSVHWSQYSINHSNSESGFETILQIYAKNSLTVIAELSNLLNDLKVQVNTLNSKVIKTNKMLQITINITCKNTTHVNTILQRIRKLEDVSDVTRGFS